MAEQPRKIKKYRKPLNLNIGMLIFGAIFIYVIICVILYFQTDHIVRYEVTEGSLATNNIYRGVSIRTEEVVSTDTAGYVNFMQEKANGWPRETLFTSWTKRAG
ncbi:MAG: HlyD family efflux transporter periplasmic adaptor subunit [Waltera sp.]